MSSDWKGMANVGEQKGPVAPGPAAVSSSGGHGGLAYPTSINTGGLREGWEDPGAVMSGGGARWECSWELSLQRLEQKTMINCPDSSRHSQPGELKEMDPEPSTGWDVGKKLWAMGEELSWVQPWGQR